MDYLERLIGMEFRGISRYVFFDMLNKEVKVFKINDDDDDDDNDDDDEINEEKFQIHSRSPLIV